MSIVLGINDRNLPYLEFLTSTELSVRGNQLIAADDSPVLSEFFSRLMTLSSGRSEPFSESELYMEYQAMGEGIAAGEGKTGPEERDYRITAGKYTLFPKSRMQKAYISSLFENQVTIAYGPAGTGKTFIAIAYALMQLLSGKKQKIVLTRPVVEAGESLGFLPGDLSQKLNPYLKPLYDAMEYILSPMQIHKLEESGSIEIAPLAYMRGRSIGRSVVILDEAQNTTRGQMKLFLTRLGEDSQAIITGDPGQIDLPRRSESGLMHAVSILHDIPSLSMIEFTTADIIRSRMVKAIIACYEAEEERDGKR